MLLTDFVSQAYLDKLNSESVDTLYHASIDSLIDIQLIAPSSFELPFYDKSLLKQEMELFPRWFLDEHLAIYHPVLMP